MHICRAHGHRQQYGECQGVGSWAGQRGTKGGKWGHL